MPLKSSNSGISAVALTVIIFAFGLFIGLTVLFILSEKKKQDKKNQEDEEDKQELLSSLKLLRENMEEKDASILSSVQMTKYQMDIREAERQKDLHVKRELEAELDTITSYPTYSLHSGYLNPFGGYYSLPVGGQSRRRRRRRRNEMDGLRRSDIRALRLANRIAKS
jgi:hypothetical protein